MECAWAFANEADRVYHDREWGVPVLADDRQMFEHLSLECLQCGLSWGLMLKKRDIFRRCFDGFDLDKVAAYGEADVQRILATPGMLRAEFGSLCGYFWHYTGDKTVLYRGHAEGKLPVSNGLSADISRDLKKRGFRFVGPVTIYSHLQACGIINDHAGGCPRYAAVNAMNPTVQRDPDREVF